MAVADLFPFAVTTIGPDYGASKYHVVDALQIVLSVLSSVPSNAAANVSRIVASAALASVAIVVTSK